MKIIRLFLSFALLLFTISSAMQPAMAQPPTSTNLNGPLDGSGYTINLPIVINGQPSQPTSFDLIDQAIASGKLTAEQGLIYKVYALFSDAALPTIYIGGGPILEDGDAVMRAVVEQSATLSDATRQTLAPFFVPPDDSRSWYYRKHTGSSTGPQPMQVSDVVWRSFEAAGGNVRVAFRADWSRDEESASFLAGRIDSEIWPKLTKLMKKVPKVDPGAGATVIFITDSYLQDGVVTPFDPNTLGLTSPSSNSCQQTAVKILINRNRPDGDENTPGMLQTVTHELMHAIQFAYPMAACEPYNWAYEATAKWSEDYVYPMADSEHNSAPAYLNRASARLDDTTGLHHYGAYLLFYYLTHSIDPTAAVVRKFWENAAGTANSYQAMDDAVNQVAPAMHDYYWAWFLTANWNIGPFDTYYKTKDRLSDTVAQAGGSAIPITAPGREQITPLFAQIPTGGAYYFHLSFPDDTVSSVTVLNGLGYKLKTGPADQDEWLSGSVKDGDETYLFDDISADDLTGANLILLMKVAGQDGQTLYMTLPNLNTQNDGFCLDAQGKIEDMVVILSNSDFAHPDRIMKQQGIPTTIFANNIPCYKLTGTTKMTYTATDSTAITKETDATVTYQNNLIPDIQMIAPTHVFPDIQLNQVSADVNWTISGGSPSSWYTGGDHYTAGAANCTLHIMQGILQGGPSYRGYFGCGDPDSGTEIQYIYHWIDSQTHTQHDDPETDSAWRFLDIDLAVDYMEKYYPVKSDGSLSESGSFTYDWGGMDKWSWNLTGQKK